MFLLYPFGALLSAFFALLTVVLSPILALLVDSNGNLPRYLYWFQTFDNTFISGPQSVGWTPGYWSSVRWLCRNPAYGFDLFLLGLPLRPEDWTVVRDEPTGHFFAYSRWGAFSYRGAWFKWGWKAWAGVGAHPNPVWVKLGKLPIVVLR